MSNGRNLSRLLGANDKITEDKFSEDIVLVDSADVSLLVKSETVFNLNLIQNGPLKEFSGTKRWYAPFDLSVTKINSRLGTAADAPVVVVVNKNDSAEKTFSFDSNSTTTTIVDPTFSMLENDYLTVDVTDVGLSNPGENLYLQFTYQKA